MAASDVRSAIIEEDQRIRNLRLKFPDLAQQEDIRPCSTPRNPLTLGLVRMRQGFRGFRVDRIACVSDGETGEIVDPKNSPIGGRARRELPGAEGCLKPRRTCGLQDLTPLQTRYSIFTLLLLEESRSSEATVVARIYQPARTAMQSGDAKTRLWVLEYEPDLPREAEPLMGWTSSADMKQQIVLRFPTKDEATAYAIRNGIPYRVFEPHPRAPTKKAYADNFKYGRIGSWTH
jgi:hypothetical protein